MRGRDKQEANEQREELFAAAKWKCVVCGKPLRSGTPMLAHRVIRSKHNVAIYGSRIIDHPMNLVPVESLRCNDATIVNFIPAERLLSEIFDVTAGAAPWPDMSEFYDQLSAEFEERRNR